MRITKSLKLRTNSWILITILVLAAALRLWNLDIIPPHLTPDEASLGYNAYSILKTGRDEYGELFPVIFKSFGDFKPGFYIYLTTPFVAVFGLNELAVRLPSAIAGVFAVWLTYLVVKELFKKQKKFSIGILAAFLIAINPWHVHFSRGAWEANVSLTLTLAGIYLFLRSFKSPRFLIASSALFSLTFLTYQGAKLSTIIILVVLTVSFWEHCKKLVRKNMITVVQSTVVGLIVITPILFSLIEGKAGRLEVFSVFSYRRPTEELQSFLDQGSEKVGDMSYYLFHSEKLNFERGILGRWFNHFSGRFLFFEGDWQNLRHSAPNHGMLFLADLVLLIIGFVGLIRLKGKAQVFIFLWLILAPLPAALSRDQVHAVRALNMVVPLTIISAFGLRSLLIRIKKIAYPTLQTTSYLILLAIYIGSTIYFLDAYFVHLPKHDAKYWFYGYKQVIEELAPIQNNYNKIIFQQSYNQPYIYFLFHQKYPPKDYQKQAKLTEGGIDVGLVEKLDNIKFELFSWPVRGDEKILIVGDFERIPEDFSRVDYKLISDIKYPDSLETTFRIIELK